MIQDLPLYSAEPCNEGEALDYALLLRERGSTQWAVTAAQRFPRLGLRRIVELVEQYDLRCRRRARRGVTVARSFAELAEVHPATLASVTVYRPTVGGLEITPS